MEDKDPVIAVTISASAERKSHVVTGSRQVFLRCNRYSRPVTFALVGILASFECRSPRMPVREVSRTQAIVVNCRLGIRSMPFGVEGPGRRSFFFFFFSKHSK